MAGGYLGLTNGGEGVSVSGHGGVPRGVPQSDHLEVGTLVKGGGTWV